MTPEEAVANLIELASLDREQFIKKIPEFNEARARVLAMMQPATKKQWPAPEACKSYQEAWAAFTGHEMQPQDPADTAASALADVQAIREQGKLPRRVPHFHFDKPEPDDASGEKFLGETSAAVLIPNTEHWVPNMAAFMEKNSDVQRRVDFLRDGFGERCEKLEQANRDAYEAYKLLRDRVAALEGKS